MYRRYASLFFIVGVDSDNENELAILEFIHALVTTQPYPSQSSVRHALSRCRSAWGSRTQPSLTAAVREVSEMAMHGYGAGQVETLDRYFENVCELDIMFNLEKAHFILDEMVRSRRTPALCCNVSTDLWCARQVMNGCIVETNKSNVLQPLLMMEKNAT